MHCKDCDCVFILTNVVLRCCCCKKGEIVYLTKNIIREEIDARLLSLLYSHPKPRQTTHRAVHVITHLSANTRNEKLNSLCAEEGGFHPGTSKGGMLVQRAPACPEGVQFTRRYSRTRLAGGPLPCLALPAPPYRGHGYRCTL